MGWDKRLRRAGVWGSERVALGLGGTTCFSCRCLQSGVLQKNRAKPLRPSGTQARCLLASKKPSSAGSRTTALLPAPQGKQRLLLAVKQEKNKTKTTPVKHSETTQPRCPSLACCGTLDDTGNCGWLGLALQRACYSSASSLSDLVGSQVTGSKLPGTCPQLRDGTCSVLL